MKRQMSGGDLGLFREKIRIIKRGKRPPEAIREAFNFESQLLVMISLSAFIFLKPHIP